MASTKFKEPKQPKDFKALAQPMIVVNSVSKSSKWYQKILDCKSNHGGNEYDQITDGRRLILQLHAWDTHEHDDELGDQSDKSRGNGILLWFQVANMERALKAIKSTKAKVVKKVHTNPFAGHREVWIKDLDGYTVVLAGK